MIKQAGEWLLPDTDQAPYRAFDIVVVATSLGGLAALRQVLGGLPPDFPAPLVVVQHLNAGAKSALAELLADHTSLAVKWVESDETPRARTVYIAPPDRHVLVTKRRTLRLSQADKVHYTRPAADVLFHSVAAHYRAGALAVVLTGALSDGAAGVQAIKRRGGWVLAQDRATAEAAGMPTAAIRTGCVDFVLPLPLIPRALTALVMARGARSLFSVPTLPFAGSAPLPPDRAHFSW